jgi:hypothetical protein
MKSVQPARARGHNVRRQPEDQIAAEFFSQPTQRAARASFKPEAGLQPPVSCKFIILSKAAIVLRACHEACSKVALAR